MLDRSLMVRTRYLKHLLKVIPQGTSLWLGRSLVGRHYQVVGAELALFLLFLLRTGSRSFTQSDDFFPIGMVNGQVKELSDVFRLDSPYPVDKGLAHGTILESGDNLVVGHVGELGAVLGEAAYIVIETLSLLLPAMAKLVGIDGPGVGALEVPYEGISKLGPAVEPPSREVLKSGTRRVSEVQRDALDDK
jgi:hypothetical protein